MGQLPLGNEFVKHMGDLCPCHKMLQTWCKYRLLPKSLSNSPDEFVKFYQQGSPNSIKKLDHRLYQGMCFQCNAFKKIAIKNVITLSLIIHMHDSYNSVHYIELECIINFYDCD